MLSWLNPMNWIKLISLAKSIMDGAIALFKYFQDQRLKASQNKQIDTMSVVEQELVEANKIKDEDARLKAKAAAVKKLEEAISSRS